jgi:hypothetical protein
LELIALGGGIADPCRMPGVNPLDNKCAGGKIGGSGDPFSGGVSQAKNPPVRRVPDPRPAELAQRSRTPSIGDGMPRGTGPAIVAMTVLVIVARLCSILEYHVPLPDWPYLITPTPRPVPLNGGGGGFPSDR